MNDCLLRGGKSTADSRGGAKTLGARLTLGLDYPGHSKCSLDMTATTIIGSILSGVGLTGLARVGWFVFLSWVFNATGYTTLSYIPRAGVGDIARSCAAEPQESGH